MIRDEQNALNKKGQARSERDNEARKGKGTDMTKGHAG